MTKTRLFVAGIVMLACGVANAGGQSGSIGVGAEIQLNGIGGGSLNYDAGDFHVGGFLGFHDPGGSNDDVLDIGGRFYYHLHSTAMSDFGLGGSLGISSENHPAGMGGRLTLLFIEPGFQIRLFLASNVALSFSTGVTIGVMDAKRVDLGGQVTAVAGIHYYFF